MFGMKRFIAKIENDMAIIEGEELVHLKSVLRLKVGDEVCLVNGDGNDYLATIANIGKNSAVANINSITKNQKCPKKNLQLFISATKREKLEIIVQKAVELGVKSLYIFESEYSTMKLSSEKISRYEKIALAATKQCERADFMNINIVSFKEMLSLFGKCKTKLFANERQGEPFDFSSLKVAQEIGILVGCEGGFSQSEKAQILSLNPENISLGERILRAETAAIVLTGIASLHCGN